MAEAPDALVGALTTRSALEFRGNEPQQILAWRTQIGILRHAFSQLPRSRTWDLLLEYPLRRLSRRPDAVILAPGVIIVVEFKIGAEKHSGEYMQQAEDYALCIRDFHSCSRGHVIIPIVCAERAPSIREANPRIIDCVASTILTNGLDLPRALDTAAAVQGNSRATLSWHEFDRGAYSPTPNIVDAARAVYSGHSVAEIGRTDADGLALQRTAERLRHWVLEAHSRKTHVICLVSGTPGAGKSLLGLNLILADGAGRIAGEPAVMLTGNRPLVQVLRGALTADSRSRGEDKGAGRAIEGALQTLLGYLREHAAEGSPPPPEHVVVFDEAQRAWDEETGQKLLQRRKSEPELFLEILHRLPWACLVCLVGPGQEINRGEGGLALWASALRREASAGRSWEVIAPRQDSIDSSLPAVIDPALYLASGVRAYRNARFGEWVDALLRAEIGRANRLAQAMSNPPAFITRDLLVLKNWLRFRRRGGRRPGLVVSSAAVRLSADGVPFPPKSNELQTIENWFLKFWPDFRGSDSLELPLSEFGCQGLELDYVGVCWGGDLIWSAKSNTWVARRMRAPAWQLIRHADSAKYRLNTYRVLLTRAREGVCIYVPRGHIDDPTRQPADFDAIADVLCASGCIGLRPE